jgi:transposase-like protein
MYPLSWTNRKEGIFMHFSYEFKRKCIDLYREGSFPDVPQGVSRETLRKKIWEWACIEEKCGAEALKKSNKKWSAEEKFELVSRVLDGESITSVAISNALDGWTLSRWVKKYGDEGYNGLIDHPKGRTPKKLNMKKDKNNLSKPLTETEREELLRLREENESIKAEIEVIKKRMALRREKEAARLKAKKQQSSKNSGKKDTN